jgi:hypothetical protein
MLGSREGFYSIENTIYHNYCKHHEFCVNNSNSRDGVLGNTPILARSELVLGFARREGIITEPRVARSEGVNTII